MLKLYVLRTRNWKYKLTLSLKSHIGLKCDSAPSSNKQEVESSVVEYGKV